MASMLTARIEDLARIVDGGWSDRVMQDRLRHEQDWSATVRGRYTAGLRQTLEDWLRHQWVLDQRLKKRPRSFLLSALHLGLMELESGRPAHAVLSTLLKAVRKLSRAERGLVNAVLAGLIRDGQPLAPLPPHWDRALSAEERGLPLSLPGWLVELLDKLAPGAPPDRLQLDRCLRQWRGKDFWLRVNGSRWNREQASSHLEGRGWRVEAAAEDPCFLRATAMGPGGPEALEALRDGRLRAQDLSTCGSIQLMDLKPGLRVLDMCAAPGNKSLAMLDREPAIRLTAIEQHEGRARNLKRRLPSRVELIVADAREPGRPDACDRILLDAPCSGSGTLARRPEMLLRPDPVTPELLQLQVKLLDNAARQVTPGGHIVYSTCSLDPRENSGQALAFLRRNPQFRLQVDLVPPDCRDSSGGWSWQPFELGPVTPRPGANGAWACVLERQA